MSPLGGRDTVSSPALKPKGRMYRTNSSGCPVHNKTLMGDHSPCAFRLDYTPALDMLSHFSYLVQEGVALNKLWTQGIVVLSGVKFLLKEKVSLRQCTVFAPD